MIIAVDFDGTLCEEAYPKIGKANVELISLLLTMRKYGHELILWTCRSGALLDNAIEWCEKRGLRFDAYNTNLPRIIEEYRGRDSRKITYDMLIDDRNTTPEEVVKKIKNNSQCLFLDIYNKEKSVERIDRMNDSKESKTIRLPLPHMISKNGQQYLTLGEDGNYFACAFRPYLKQTFEADELSSIPEEYRQFIPSSEV